jgi:hypothetical protein
MRDIPIALLSFNRPQYLSQVLDSLAAQTALNGRRVHLFQDNAFNPFSHIRYAADEDIAACVRLFSARFPDGVVHVAPHNLGIALNFRRAEEFVFDHLESEVAYFFEDDMVLSPHYLAIMDRISGWVRQAGTVGYFSAYGQCTKHRQQRRPARRMRRLGLHWGFGLTQQHWQELSAWLAPYYRIAERHDYRRLPKQPVYEHYHALGIPLYTTSQDIIKRMGTYALGRVGINTHDCFARYIGAEGVHSNRAEFEARGYATAQMCPRPVELIFPTKQELSRFWDKEIAGNIALWTERSGGALLPTEIGKPSWYCERDRYAERSGFGDHVRRRIAQLAAVPLSRRGRHTRARSH